MPPLSIRANPDRGKRNPRGGPEKHAEEAHEHIIVNSPETIRLGTCNRQQHDGLHTALSCDLCFSVHLVLCSGVQHVGDQRRESALGSALVSSDMSYEVYGEDCRSRIVTSTTIGMEQPVGQFESLREVEPYTENKLTTWSP